MQDGRLYTHAEFKKHWSKNHLTTSELEYV
jgi:hypothetical protein